MNEKARPGDPLKRPLQERLDIPEEQHLAFWYQVLRDFDWETSRIQSKLLYYNKAKQPEGDVPS